MTVRKNLRKNNLKTLYSISANRTCKHCGKPLKGKAMYYCSEKCKQKYWSSEAKLQNNSSIIHPRTLSGRLKRYKVILYKGGKCEKCGYNKNSAALSFHHLDINNKRFEIENRNCSAYNLETLYKEADKCILLCANCHMELHNPDLMLDKLKELEKDNRTSI